MCIRDRDDVLLATYGNAAQGFSLLVDAGAFAVSEGEGAGATFRLTSDPASYFAVSYVADWLGTPDVGEYLEEQLWHGQMGHGDTYVQISADGGEVVYLADVAMDAIAYGYVDADTGQNMVVIQAMEPRSDGSAVYWTLVASDESAEEVATALVVASATFRVGADAYQESNLWCAPEDLQARPAGTGYSLADPTVGDAGGSALVDVYKRQNELMVQTGHRADFRVLKNWADHCGEAFDWWAGAYEDLLWQYPGGEVYDRETQTFVVNGNTYEPYEYPRDHEHVICGTLSFRSPNRAAAQEPIVTANWERAQQAGAQGVFDTPGRQLVKDGERVAGVIAQGLADGSYTKVLASKMCIRDRSHAGLVG